ncbi:hypothetical protein [Candidatus Nitrosopumilus sediminis]|nr:hypothetical protein [Candidatus Nitrosopumilus sediminis]
MRNNTPIDQIKSSVKSSVEKISSYSEEVISKWKIGRRNFP